jgi:predicted MFS family arabinose efflux permease
MALRRQAARAESRPRWASRTEPPARRVLVLAATAAGVAQGFGRFSYALVIPALRLDLLHSYAVAGLLGTVNVTAYLLGTVAVSVASTRAEPARLIRSGLVGTTAGLLLLPSASGVPVLAVGMALTGFSAAFVWVPAPGLAGSVVPPHRRGLAVGLSGCGIGAGIVFASGLAAVVHASSGPRAWRAVWLVEGLVSLLVLAAAARWLHPPAPAEPPAPVRVSVLRSVPGWQGATASYAAYGLAYAIYMNYLVAALEHDAGFSAAHAAADFTVVGAAILTGGVVLGRVSDQLGRRHTLVLGYLLMAAGIGAVPLGSEPWAVLSALLFGVAMSGLPTVLAAHLGDHLDPRAIGAAFGSLTLAFGLAQLAGPQLGGFVADQTGSFTGAFLGAAALALVGAGAAAVVPGRPLSRPNRRS